MFANLRQSGIDPEGYADGAVTQTIERYARCLNLPGLSSSITDYRCGAWKAAALLKPAPRAYPCTVSHRSRILVSDSSESRSG
jgi:hypothetical protein